MQWAYQFRRAGYASNKQRVPFEMLYVRRLWGAIEKRRTICGEAEPTLLPKRLRKRSRNAKRFQWYVNGAAKTPKFNISLFSLFAQTITMLKTYFHRKSTVDEVQSVLAPFWTHNSVVHSRRRLMFRRNPVAKCEKIWPKRLDSVCVSFRLVGNRPIRSKIDSGKWCSLRPLQVWFQNQRAKVKKIQKKSRLDAKNAINNDQDTAGDRKIESTSTKVKNENESKFERNWPDFVWAEIKIE